MNIHEHQAKELLKKYGAPVSKGFVIYSKSEISQKSNNLESKKFVLKAQIHAGGRGKAGGVKLVNDRNELIKEANEMFGKVLITHQTGPEGKEVGRVYIEEGSEIERELYLSILVDRATSKVSFIASTEGGMDIEEVAAETPEKILTVGVDPIAGMTDANGQEIASALELTGNQVDQCVTLVKNLYKAFVETDMSLLEINPLVVNGAGDLICLDAKVNFDSNALYRHDDIVELRDLSEEDPAEVEASKYDLSYVKLDGSIGCMVNGAGLAMATMDIIKLYGEEPANFLDVGGGATKEKVTEAFKIILSDSNVKGILVNIFGGIMRCDIIAEGVIAAASELALSVPLVVRLEGTNVEQGKKIMAASGLAIIPADNLEDAAEKIVAAVREAA